MQQQGIAFLASAVKPIAYDGGAKSFGMGGMQAELVGSAGERVECHPRSAIFNP